METEPLLTDFMKLCMQRHMTDISIRATFGDDLSRGFSSTGCSKTGISHRRYEWALQQCCALLEFCVALPSNL